jgi:hypothetical protein
LLDWKGLWIEGDQRYCELIRKNFESVTADGRLTVVNQFVNRENINDIFTENGFTGEIDLLSIDIDGNDYYIFEVISSVNPRVIIIEYNGKFPPECDWKMLYNKDHVWNLSDNFGASLNALEDLGARKGYQLVGTNGTNAFFVRNDLAQNLFPMPATAANLYNWGGGHISKKCVKR